MRLLLALLFCAALACAQPKTEVGEINGAQFRIDTPEKWNGSLIMYCDGYRLLPGVFDSKPLPLLSMFLNQGYAVAQSGYSAGGWAVQEAVHDTEALRRYFSRKYTAPKETYVMGHSFGGFLTMTLLEKFPNSYDGGLSLCGPLAAPIWFMNRHAFDMRVVFDYYFPGALPTPAKVPSDFTMAPTKTEEIDKLLDSKPAQSAVVRRWAAIRTNKELAETLVFNTYVLKDVQERGGGNPFDNRNTIYEGSDNDNALNDGVVRYAAEPRAVAYLQRYYTPSGHLARPLLAIHTTYDPAVPPWITNMYSKIVESAGSDNFFVQQYVGHDGHCEIHPAEIARGFMQLRQWVADGTRPASGSRQ